MAGDGTGTSVTYDEIFGHFVRAGGVQIHHGDLGTGEPVVLLHGTGPGSNAWNNFHRNIGPLADHFRVLPIDLPRFGRSAKVALPGPRLDVLSGVVKDVLDALGIPRAHVIGNSMGAQVALKVAIDAPARVGKLALVAPAAIGRSVFTPMPTEVVGMIAGYYRDEGPTREKMRRLARALVYDPERVTDEMIEARYQDSIDPEVVEVNRAPHWAHQSLEHELDKVQSETLLLWGQDDRASPFDHALLMLRAIARSRLFVFGRCGHSAQLEYPDEFNRIVVDFLTR